MTDDRVGNDKKSKDNDKEFSRRLTDEIVLGNLVIMRFLGPFMFRGDS